MDKKSNKIVAIIPARGGSKGIPNKNIVDFCGKPLLAWTIIQASKSKLIEEIYVTSDDSKILSVSKSYGAIGIERPLDISGDFASSESALLHCVEEIEKKSKKTDYVVFLQATSPLRSFIDIERSIELTLNNGYDSLFSSCPVKDYFIWQKTDKGLESINYDHKNRKRRQDVPEQYVENGSIYIFKTAVLKKYNNRLGDKIGTYIMDSWKVYEIDNMDDLELCGWLFRKKILKEEMVLYGSK